VTSGELGWDSETNHIHYCLIQYFSLVTLIWLMAISSSILCSIWMAINADSYKALITVLYSFTCILCYWVSMFMHLRLVSDVSSVDHRWYWSKTVALMRRMRKVHGMRCWWYRAVYNKNGQYGDHSAACTGWTTSFMSASLTALSVFCRRWQKTLSVRSESWYDYICYSISIQLIVATNP